METLVIPTRNLDLRLQTPAETLAWVDNLPPADRAEVSPDWIARVKATPVGDPWSLGYVVVERSTGTTVGGCAFKGPPIDGMVEVAYGIDEPHRCRGFATELTSGLARFAFDRGMTTVRAHTKPDNGPSTRVLEKCGFTRLGDVIDPEDGLVSRWELAASKMT